MLTLKRGKGIEKAVEKKGILFVFLFFSNLPAFFTEIFYTLSTSGTEMK
jgi:hypothetical protein